MEESMISNGWINLPTFENFDQSDHAIRQFCPARVAQEEQENNFEITWPRYFGSEAPQPPPQFDIDEIFDTFFNVECYEKDNNALNYFSQDQDRDQEETLINEPFYHHFQLDEEDDDLMIDVEELDRSDGADCSITIGVDQGLHLVHLLLACAEAIGCRDGNLANSILAQIWPRVSAFGDSMQRVSHCFAVGLKSRLSLLHSINPNGSFNTTNNRANLDLPLITEEKSEAFYLLHQTTPYIAFGYAAANDAIFRAASGKSSLHIVDLGMEHNFQWPMLVRKLAFRKEGPPKIIRLTGIVGRDNNNQKLLLELECSLKSLCEEAVSLGTFVEYHLVHEQVSPLSLTREKLYAGEEEALFVNSIMHLHKHVGESRGSLKNILQAIKKLKPTLLTVVEQDANHNGPFFLGRFLESLHYYSAVFDSLEATLPRSCERRRKIERAHFADEIQNVVAYEGSDRFERHERADQWRRQLGRGGFQVVGLKCLDEVEAMVAACGGSGYTVAGEKGCLQLGWKGRPIMFASAWQMHN
ncbi:hypothetical protein ABFS82_08G160400 [Erythranthe guttata]|uniref:Uncharacterized protein n=1 Tax=Erythranthe guttata TaxID=4155 RepID=A0A022R1D8_ERYGU|nr:PREDICTED: DELLA protein RGA2-like [Erythranthe guttata]EYU33794.1 hypothetical protein MIMGU_mgv1a020653mg [Erythranthe guttata]|eukprot:XP_012841885.1 PREDICTED: DELLA protein RGA2-like [Erythranthe guttata]